MAIANPQGHRPAGRFPLLLIVFNLALMAGTIQASSPARAAQAAAPGSSSGNLGEAVSPSTPEQLALAEHLRQRGAVFYGAWWCSHCFHQKNLFGTEAGRLLPYVECDKEEAGRQRCAAANVGAYPTWVLGGERKEGVQSMKELIQWSGFKGAKP